MAERTAPLRDLVVVAGGGGERLGGIDKATSVVDGHRLIDHALNVPVTGRRIMVRPPGRHPIGPTAGAQPAESVTEWPAGGGPVAGVAAAIAALRRAKGSGEGSEPGVQEEGDLVAVLAADHLAPLGVVVSKLIEALHGAPRHGVAVAAPGGQAQWLTAVWRRSTLIAAIAALATADGAAARALVGHGAPLFVPTPRVASLDDGGDLWAAVAGGSAVIGVSGSLPARSRVAEALARGVKGLTAADGIDPANGAATLLAAAEAQPMPSLASADRRDIPWVFVGPPVRSPVPWARVHLVPLDS